MLSCFFINSVSSKNFNLTNYLIEIGADVNTKSDSDYTPLNLAVFNQDVNIAKLLIEHGADVNIDSSSNINNLDYSIFKQNINLVELLLENDANITNKEIATGIHLLVSAVANGNLDIAKLLIKYGIDVNAKDSRGKTPIFAVKSQKMAQLLIDSGANINIKVTGSGETPIFNFVRQGNIDLIKLSVEHGLDVDAINNFGNTPLFYIKDKDIARLLVDSGANINHKNKLGETPLFYVLGSRRNDVAKLLIDKGANVTAKTNVGRTTLFEAHTKEIAQLIINLGVNVTDKDSYGYTALYFAVDKRLVDVAQLLINRGADVNAELHGNGGFYTTLLLAIRNEDFNMIKLLINNGVKINTEKQQVKIPLVEAIKELDKDIVQLLLDRGAEPKYLEYKNIEAYLYNYTTYNRKQVKKFLANNNFAKSKQ